ncbi:MAG: DUF2127 domain-containing protein [Polaromonas sp.]|nr:DUF2127 domain-containing protein [Polaromonas sp.]
MTPAPQASAAAPAAGAHQKALHAIAVFEALKGVAALIAAIGLLGLLHHDVHRLALALIWHFHLDPAARYPEVLLHYADLLSHIDLRTLAPVAIGYISIRFVEAWGLWKEKVWAEWLGALSGGVYIPLEVAHLQHRPGVINAAVLAVNLLMVAFLALQLWRRRHAPAVAGSTGA